MDSKLNQKIKKLLGVKIPKITKTELKDQILGLEDGNGLNKAEKSIKKNLYFLYSEFLLRACRNPYYRQVLNDADQLAVDGKGTQWAIWAVNNAGFLPKIYQKSYDLHPYFRLVLFPIVLVLQLIFNYIISAYQLLNKKDYSNEISNELILGRDFSLEILEIAVQKKWNVLVIAGGKNPLEIEKALQEKFKGLRVKVHLLDPSSRTMKDNLGHKFLTKKDLFEKMPELLGALKWVQSGRFDLIINGIGGESGKQEFFLDYIKNDPKCSYKLAIGVGAAYDSLLKTGAKQRQVPNWMVKTGLEWLFRLITQPYRRKRVLDSVLTLWWWVSVQQFMQNGVDRLTVVNVIQNQSGQFLVVRSRGILPGDMEWTFVQGGVELYNKTFQTNIYLADYLKGILPKKPFETEIVQNGLREAWEEVKMLPKDLLITHIPVFSQKEEMAISFVRFWFQGGKYNVEAKYLNFALYMGENEPRTNWENASYGWASPDEMAGKLLTTKVPDWQRARKVIGV
jgi:exopolysaccharide biosynthesis WecB/TagA/CpsF family protein